MQKTQLLKNWLSTQRGGRRWEHYCMWLVHPALNCCVNRCRSHLGRAHPLVLQQLQLGWDWKSWATWTHHCSQCQHQQELKLPCGVHIEDSYSHTQQDSSCSSDFCPTHSLPECSWEGVRSKTKKCSKTMHVVYVAQETHMWVLGKINVIYYTSISLGGYSSAHQPSALVE